MYRGLSEVAGVMGGGLWEVAGVMGGGLWCPLTGSSLMQTQSFCVGLDREMQVAQNLLLNPAQSSPFASHSTQGLGV